MVGGNGERRILDPGCPLNASPANPAGLCARCAWMRRITSRRGSVFRLCGRHREDPTFPKYPPLPALRCRGFDQAELLARALGREIGLPVVSLLKRVDAAGQTGRSRSQRFCAPAFEPRRSPPSAVLVADDVITTGATLQAAAKCLVVGGAERVDAVVAGATPLPSARRPPGVATMRSHNPAPVEREPPWT